MQAYVNHRATNTYMCPAAADRSVSFHARFGAYFRTRTPRQGRDLAYAPFTAELLVVGSAPEVYRINLAEGRFMTPLPAKSSGINACGACDVQGLTLCITHGCASVFLHIRGSSVFVQAGSGVCCMLPVRSSGWLHGLVVPLHTEFAAADIVLLFVPPLLPLPGLSPSHGLFAAAGEDGQLECFDLRARSSIATLDTAAAAGSPGALEP
jgi:hypothetical protein